MPSPIPPIEIKTSPIRDKYGKFAPGKEPPLVSLSVINPLTYIKIWVQKITNNEGMDVHFRIHPLTMIVISFIFAVGGFSVGRATLKAQIANTPLGKYVSFDDTTQIVKDVGYTGYLRYSTVTSKYYLETAGGEVIILVAPTTINLSNYIGPKILVAGKLNTQNGMVSVEDVSMVNSTE